MYPDRVSVVGDGLQGGGTCRGPGSGSAIALVPDAAAHYTICMNASALLQLRGLTRAYTEGDRTRTVLRGSISR